MSKAFKAGFMVGRFQHWHSMHQAQAEILIASCERTVIMVGSSQAEGTVRNPFSYDFRRDIILNATDDLDYESLMVAPLKDTTTEDDINHDWGRWVLHHASNALGMKPDFMIYGDDENRHGWFAPEDIQGITELVIPRREGSISATQLRQYIAANNFWSWREHVPNTIWNHFGTIREELLKVPEYRGI